MSDTTVLIVGGGFAGVACAQELAKQDVDVILLDQNNYHQFQPMLYQVATAQLAAYDIARPLRGIFRHNKTVEVRHTGVTSIDPDARSVTTALGSSHHRGLPGPGTWRASELLRYAGSGRALPSALLGERCRTTARAAFSRSWMRPPNAQS